MNLKTLVVAALLSAVAGASFAQAAVATAPVAASAPKHHLTHKKAAKPEKGGTAAPSASAASK